MDEFAVQYAALTEGVGLVDLVDRTQIEITGSDRAKFLHNLCTNAVRELPAGSGCEAFLLNAKGHIVGYVNLFAGEQSLVLETAAGQSARLMAHLDRYIIREDVQLHDRTTQWAEVLVAGDQVETLLTDQCLPVPKERLEHAAATIAGHEAWVRRVDWVGPQGFAVAMLREALEDVANHLIQAGAIRCEAAVFETRRIEQGTPIFGREISEENLPQEVDRDRQAIHFTKGCYLGQETVARIDALGHVNRLLRGIGFAGSQIPPVGTELIAAGKPVGVVTSSCWSPRLKTPLALAYVRRGHHEPGSKLEGAGGVAEVIALPLA